MLRQLPEKSRPARAILAVGILASYVCPALCTHYGFNASIPKCNRKSYYLDPVDTDVTFKVYYDRSAAQRAMSDVLATMVYNALGIPIEPVFSEDLGCDRGDDACLMQTYGKIRDVDLMTLIFGRSVQGGRTFVNSNLLKPDEIPYCFLAFSNVYIDSVELEKAKKNRSFCPYAVLNRGAAFAPGQYGLFVTPAAVDLLGRGEEYSESPIFYRELYNTSWLSHFPAANRTLVEAAYVDKWTYFPELAKGRQDPFYFVPDQCVKQVEKCRIVHKNLGTGEAPGMLEGLVRTYKLPLIVYWMKPREYVQLTREFSAGLLGPTLFSGYVPSEVSNTGVVPVFTGEQRIQFPTCYEGYRAGPNGAFATRQCDFPLVYSSKAVSKDLLEKLPITIPLVDMLWINFDNIDAVLATNAPGADPSARAQALCAIAEQTLERPSSGLKELIGSCTSAKQAVDWETNKCIIACPVGSEPRQNRNGSRLVCKCKEGWHLKRQYPSLQALAAEVVGNFSMPDNFDFNIFQKMFFVNQWAGFDICRITANGWECDYGDTFAIPEMQQCAPCPPGYICPGGEQPPVACAVAHSVSPVGSSQQNECICAGGHTPFRTPDGQVVRTQCSACAAGRYKPYPGDDMCQGKCPPKTTSFPGAWTRFLCICEVDHYMIRMSPDNICDKCPDGAFCPRAASQPLLMDSIVRADWYGSRLLQGVPTSKIGYNEIGGQQMPPSDLSAEFIPRFSKCPMAAGCLAMNKCAEGSAGYLCSECPPGYGRGRVKPFPCKKCSDGTSSLVQFCVHSVIATGMLVGLTMLTQLAHERADMFSIAVIKAIWDHFDIVETAILVSPFKRVMYVQGWPDPRFSGFNEETIVWCFSTLWDLVQSVPFIRGLDLTSGAGSTLFHCLLESHPEWQLGNPKWTANARIEYTRLIVLIFAVFIQYLACMIVWFPIYRILVFYRRERLERVTTFLVNTKLLEHFATGYENYLGMGRVIRDLKTYASNLRKQNSIFLWQAVQDERVLVRKYEHEDAALHGQEDKQKPEDMFARVTNAMFNAMADVFNWLFFYVKLFHDDSPPLLAATAFFAYPLLLKYFLAALVCDSWPDPNRDYTGHHFDRRVGNAGSIKCGSEDHVEYMVPAIIGLVVWGLGYPLFFVLRYKDMPEGWSAKDLRSAAFNIHGLDLSKWASRFWPSVIAFRKLVLWFIAIATSNPDSIVFLSLAWCGVFSYLQAQVSPYKLGKGNFLNRLQLASLFAVQSFLFFYLLTHVEVSPWQGVLIFLAFLGFHSIFFRMAFGALSEDIMNFYNYVDDLVREEIRKEDILARGAASHSKIEELPQTGDILSAMVIADEEDDLSEAASDGLTSLSSVVTENTIGVVTVRQVRNCWSWIQQTKPFAAMLIRVSWCLITCFYYYIAKPIFTVFFAFILEKTELTYVTVDFTIARLHLYGSKENATIAQEERQKFLEEASPESIAQKETLKHLVQSYRERHKGKAERAKHDRLQARGLFSTMKALAAEKNPNDLTGATENLMSLMRAQMAGHLIGYNVASIPLSWFGKIFEEASRSMMEGARVGQIAEILKDQHHEAKGNPAWFFDEENQAAMAQRLHEMADSYGHASHRHWFVLFTLTELEVRMSESQSIGSDYYLPKLLRDCMTKTTASIKDEESLCLREGRHSSKAFRRSPQAKEFQFATLGDEDLPEISPPATPRSIDSLLGRSKDDTVAWDILEGMSRADRKFLDDELQQQRELFHRSCARWLERIPTICKEYTRFEKMLREKLDSEIKMERCIGECKEHGCDPKNVPAPDGDGVEDREPVRHVPHWWAQPKLEMRRTDGHFYQGTTALDQFQRVKNLLFYDLDPDNSLELLKELEQRVRRNSWEKSHLHWILASGVQPERWFFGGLGATPDLRVYRTGSELEVLKKYQEVRLKRSRFEIGGVTDAVLQCEYQEIPQQLAEIVLERFLHTQWAFRNDPLRPQYGEEKKLDYVLKGGFDDKFMHQCIKSMPPEEQKGAVHTINSWRRAYGLAECDKLFGKALEHELTDLTTYTKLGYPYRSFDHRLVTPEIQAAAELPRGMASESERHSDHRQVVRSALDGANFYHAAKVIERRIEERQWHVEQEIKGVGDDPEKVLEIKTALNKWISYVELLFARCVFQIDSKRHPGVLKTALEYMYNRTERYHHQGVMDLETKESIMSHLERFPNRHWVVDVFWELETEASWSRFTLIKPQYRFKAKDRTRWIQSRLQESRKQEPRIRRTRLNGSPYWPQDAEQDVHELEEHRKRKNKGALTSEFEFDKGPTCNSEAYAFLKLILHKDTLKKEFRTKDEMEQKMKGEKQAIRHTEKETEVVKDTTGDWKELMKYMVNCDINKVMPRKAEIAIAASPLEEYDDRSNREKLAEWIQEQMIFGMDTSPPLPQKLVNLEAGLEMIEPGLG